MPISRVSPVARGFAPPFPDEARCWACIAKHACLRARSPALGDGTCRVFAHSVLPRPACAAAGTASPGSATKPLGEALFTDHASRLGLTYRRLEHDHPLYRAARRHTGLTMPHLWARRSVFCLNGHPLLVTEVFLPAIDAP